MPSDDIEGSGYCQNPPETKFQVARRCDAGMKQDCAQGKSHPFVSSFLLTLNLRNW